MRSWATFMIVVSLLCVFALSGCGPTQVAKYDAGKSLQEAQRYDEAIQKYEEYVDENPESPLAPYAQIYAARCYRDMAKKPAAMAAYKKVIERYPQHNLAEWAAGEMRAIENKTLIPVVAPEKKAAAPGRESLK